MSHHYLEGTENYCPSEHVITSGEAKRMNKVAILKKQYKTGDRLACRLERMHDGDHIGRGLDAWYAKVRWS